ncbi:hypothetical protein RRG08_063857, partial [Elysia crispata]
MKEEGGRGGGLLCGDVLLECWVVEQKLTAQNISACHDPLARLGLVQSRQRRKEKKHRAGRVLHNAKWCVRREEQRIKGERDRHTAPKKPDNIAQPQ